MRRQYETEQDRANETWVIDQISMRWSCQCRKLPLDYFLDYAVVDPTDESIRALIEVKCRNYTIQQIDRFGGYLLSLSKWAKAKQLCEGAGLPFFLIVKFKDEVWYFKTMTFNFDGMRWIKREDTNDPQDKEPAVLIKCSRFVKVNL